MNYNYHDATLKMIQINWIAHTVNIEMLICSEKPLLVCIIVKGVKNFSCPQKAPWGESSSVNEIKTIEITKGATQLEIKMQSEDVILIDGKKIIEGKGAVVQKSTFER
ncbi:MAG: hypothetical protein R6V06_03405 [Kiritimatiellia bacterium]